MSKSESKRKTAAGAWPFYLFVCRTVGRVVPPWHLGAFRTAFVHRSVQPHRSDATGEVNNERLEYLGDAIIEAAVSEELFRRLPGAEEGELSRTRAQLVCRNQLNRVSKRLGLDQHIVSSSPTEINRSHLPGDALEAFTAVVFQRQGWNAARRFVRRTIANADNIAMARSHHESTNSKSTLLNEAQRAGVELLFETRQEGAGDKRFASSALVNGVTVAEGVGNSKKAAEQAAATKALRQLKAGGLDLERPKTTPKP